MRFFHKVFFKTRFATTGLFINVYDTCVLASFLFVQYNLFFLECAILIDVNKSVLSILVIIHPMYELYSNHARIIYLLINKSVAVMVLVYNQSELGLVS